MADGIELPQAVLIACHMNSIRSPMAAGILQSLHPHSIYVDSCGVRAGDHVNGFAVTVMDEIGIDISTHRPKTFGDLQDANFDLVISLSPKAQHSAVEMTRHMACELEFWHTLDPSAVEGSREVSLNVYRDIRDILLNRIMDRFPTPGLFADV